MKCQPHSLESQPLREAVSWNIKDVVSGAWEIVSLFVRLWVEMFFPCTVKELLSVSLFVRLWVEITPDEEKLFRLRSASSWGCELKYKEVSLIWPIHTVSLFVRLWVEMLDELGGPKIRNVSLFVRLWVEMEMNSYVKPRIFVSLFVRLWVEM